MNAAKPSHRRITIATLTFLIFIAAGGWLSIRLTSQIYFHLGSRAFQEGRYPEAIERLNTSLRLQPNDNLTLKRLAEAYHRHGGDGPLHLAYPVAQKALDAYEAAFRNNPLDAEAAFGKARLVARLEKLYPLFYHGPNPHDAQPAFETALQLRPAGTQYQLQFARYLSHKNITTRLYEVIEDMVHNYPPILRQLKMEGLWSPEIQEACKSGLVRYIQSAQDPTPGHMEMAYLLEFQNDYSRAIEHFQKVIHSSTTSVAMHDRYYHLGRLHLANGQSKAAEPVFLTALRVCPDKRTLLARLFRSYSLPEQAEDRVRFLMQAKEQFGLSPEADLFLARSLYHAKQFPRARRTLIALNQQRPSAEAYYWLSRIAQQERDVDAAVLAIQKATLMDPGNSHYNQLFVNLLIQLGKWTQAEAAADAAINQVSSAGLYHLRATIRRRQQNLKGAIQDWQEASRLQPTHPVFYAQAAETWRQLGDRQHALELFKKAQRLAPGNPHYQKRVNELSGHFSGSSIEQ